MYTQKLAQHLFLFNYVSILLHSFCYYEKKKKICQSYDSIFLFKCRATFSWFPRYSLILSCLLPI